MRFQDNINNRKSGTLADNGLPFARGLRWARLERGWSQQELVDRAELPIGQSTYSKVERGDVQLGLDVLLRCLAALEIPLSEFAQTIDEIRKLESDEVLVRIRTVLGADAIDTAGQKARTLPEYHGF